MTSEAGQEPRDGDIVANCGHKEQHHMFGLAGGMPVEHCMTEDCPHVATWYSCCDGCFPKALKSELYVVQHASWIGDEPAGFKLPNRSN